MYKRTIKSKPESFHQEKNFGCFMFFLNKIIIGLCRWYECQVLCVGSVSEPFWSGNRVHHSSFHKHDVSFERCNCGCVHESLRTNVLIGCFGLLINRAIKRNYCFHNNGGNDPCKINSNIYMISFAIVEIILSQIPDFNELWWLSIVAAVMSFTYSIIGLVLGVVKTIGMILFMLC